MEIRKIILTNVFIRMAGIKSLGISNRKQFVETFVWSVLLYRCESWSLLRNNNKEIRTRDVNVKKYD